MLKIETREIITDLGVLKNIRVNSTLNNQVFSYRDLHLNLLDGTVSGSGEVRLSDTGISNVQSNLGIFFNRLHIDSLVKSFNAEKPSQTKAGIPVVPFVLYVRVNFEAAEIVYRDLLVSGAKSDFEITNKTINAQDLHGNLTFGEFSANLGLVGFDGENPKINGHVDIKIDSLTLDELFQMDAFANTSNEPEYQNPANPRYARLMENTDLTIMVEAEYLSYQNAAIGNLGLDIAISDSLINVNDLKFRFASGNVHLNGYLENAGGGAQPGYLYSAADSVGIGMLLTAFDQFGQDKFTSLNSEGIISWASHYYFMLDNNIQPQWDENLMILNFNIHDAIFNEVEPIEKTLFFVGYKSKGHMMVEDLNISAFLYQDKLYFLDLFMNDNIANLDAYVMVEIYDREMDVSLEISLSDLFFRSKKKRILQTRKGIVNLDDDAKIFIELHGPLHDRKLNLISKKTFEERRKELIRDIRNAEEEFKNKNPVIPGV